MFEVENMRLGGIGSEFSQEMDKKNRRGKLGTKILGMHFSSRSNTFYKIKTIDLNLVSVLFVQPTL